MIKPTEAERLAQVESSLEQPLELDNRWNFQVTYSELEHKPVDEACILHFSTPAKPWKEWASRGKEPYCRSFLRTLERSHWFSAREYTYFRLHLTLKFFKRSSLKIFQRLTPHGA